MPDTFGEFFSLSGRAALITGGTSGIGQMIARGLLSAGAEVIITGRDPSSLEAQVKKLSEFGVCCGIESDLAKKGAANALAESATKSAPSLSILVNNAGMVVRSEFGEYDEEQWDDVLDLNLRAPFLLSQALWPTLKRNATPEKAAHILNVGSVAGLQATKHMLFPYSASKAGLHHLTRTLARRLAPDFINVNAIAPGLFPSKIVARYETDRAAAQTALEGIPLRRFGSAADMASLAIAIISNSYMTGAVIPLDGGAALLA